MAILVTTAEDIRPMTEEERQANATRQRQASGRRSYLDRMAARPQHAPRQRRR